MVDVLVWFESPACRINSTPRRRLRNCCATLCLQPERRRSHWRAGVALRALRRGAQIRAVLRHFDAPGAGSRQDHASGAYIRTGDASGPQTALVISFAHREPVRREKDPVRREEDSDAQEALA